MKEKINKMEKILIENFVIFDENSLEMVKEWIGGDKNKIKFNLIFKFEKQDNNRDRFNSVCNVNDPVIFIFITNKNSIVGAYCPLFNTSEDKWISDSKAFVFSINLNKKYPAQKLGNNYFRGSWGFHFNDIAYCDFNSRKGTFYTSGIYLNQKELEGNNDSFIFKHFYVY